jgi:hypothetical protein
LSGLGSIKYLAAAVDSARGAIEWLGALFTDLTPAAGAFGEAFVAAFAIREVKIGTEGPAPDC